MNFDRSLIFAYLEEDNIQRAYFRVKPLLTLDGDVRQEAVQLWPNEGGLRIVPDRNEQHTFKTRMRTLGAYCVIDLRNQPPEAGKIRTNKNFKPERGEVNQYILYSDTVHELPAHTFYQLFEGEQSNYAGFAAQSVTPLFFIKHNDTLYGPVSKNADSEPGPAQESSGALFELPCPDNVTRMMLCMEPSVSESTAAPQDQDNHEAAAPSSETVDAKADDAEAPHAARPVAPAEVSPAEELPVGKKLHILEQPADHKETLRQLDQPVSQGANLLNSTSKESAVPSAISQSSAALSGTPLVRTPLHVAVPQAKNRTQQVISNQLNVGKYEPPALNLPAGTAMRAVNNPVESACSSLREAWNQTSAHNQLIDCLLSLDGMRSQLEAKLCSGSSDTMLQRVLRQRLQDLEAERLTALCELDKAKRDTDQYKHELLSSIAGRLQRDTKQLEADKATALHEVENLKGELNALALQRDALLSKIDELHSAALPEAVARLLAEAHMAPAVAGTPLRLSSVSGVHEAPEMLIQRLVDACTASGITLSRNAAIALIVCFSICPRIGFSCATPAAFSTLLSNVMAAMGWQHGYAQQYAPEQKPLLGIKPIDHTPLVLMTNLANYAPLQGATKLLLNRNTAGLIRNAAYDVSQWPIWMLPALPYVDEIHCETATPVSAESVLDIGRKVQSSSRDLEEALAPVLKAAIPLSGSAKREMLRFITVCAQLMDGGLPVAADWGILLWIIPAVEKGSRQYNSLKPLLDEYPLSRASL